MLSFQVANLTRYLADSEEQVQARTLVNYTAALQWHLIYLRYLLHPDTTVLTETPEHRLWHIVHTSVELEAKKRLRDLKECMKQVRGMMTKTSPIAEKQPILRNGKEALKEQGRWVEVDFMMSLKTIVDEEGWARLKSLEQRIQLIGLGDLSKVFLSSTYYFLLNC